MNLFSSRATTNAIVAMLLFTPVLSFGALPKPLIPAPLPVPTEPISPTRPGDPVGAPLPMINTILGIDIQAPLLFFNSAGTLTYSTATGAFSVTADPLAIRINAGDPPILVFPGPGGKSIDINIQVDSSGNLIGGVPGDDLVITGEVDLDGDSIPDATGVLLSGEVTEYMGENGSGSTDLHAFRFDVTGGSLAALYGGDVAVEITSEMSNFTGSFAVDFSGRAKGNVGVVECTGTLGDFIWLDLDGNGIQDPGEPGIGGVQVILTDADGNTTTQTTMMDGLYQFAGLCGGTYTISVNPASLPPDVDVTLINAPGSNPANDSNDPDGTQVILPNNNASDQDTDFGYVPLTGALGDFVWQDLNRDGVQDGNEPGIPGVMVNLYDCAGNFLDTRLTDASGFYLFDNLASGCYVVEFISPSGFVISPMDQTSDALDSDPDPTTGFTDPVNLGPGETNLDVDAGMYQPPSAELGDRFWLDENANGIQDPGEPGIPGVTVRLLTCAGAPLGSMVTGANGGYLFTDLDAGCYRVLFTPPANCILTTQDVPPDDSVDSDANTINGLTGAINLADMQSDLTWDAGCYFPAGLGDFVWNDLNQNGVQDPGEPGIPDLLVVLLDADMAPTGMTTTTGPNGEYSFVGLVPGDYFVQFTSPAGFVFTLQNIGADDTDSDANGTGKSDVVNLSSGEFDPTIDAGVFVPDDPAITIEKSTNGFDADLPTGPFVPNGDPVLWEYFVTNTGNVTLSNVVVLDDQGVAVSCPQDTLIPGESMTCTGNGSATVDQYENVGSVSGDPPQGPPVTDDDPSHYFGANPDIDIEKHTNGVDADNPTGPFVIPGSSVTWTYFVTNTGNVNLSNVSVIDNQGVTVTCPLTNLSPGQMMTCTGNGTAVAGQYANVGSTIGTPPVGPPVTDDDPSHYFGALPAIDIEKATNGFDADFPTGPFVGPGGAVNWTYVVTNTGNVLLTNIIVTDSEGVTVTCADNELAPTESFTCTGNGTAVPGQYQNIGSVVGTPPVGPNVTDFDPSHYFGAAPEIHLEKLTNGQDADNPTGPMVPVGSTITWTYIITNMGNVNLSSIVLNDSVLGAITCDEGPIPPLDPGDSFLCSTMGIATAGQYMNMGDVCGLDPTGAQVCDDDPSHYIGADPAIDIEKATNGFDADNPTGPFVAPGGTVNWTYLVTNTGNVTLVDVTVSDNQGVTVTCPGSVLTPGQSFTCTASGIAVAGQYANIGSVVGTPPVGPPVTDTDPSHYFGFTPGITVEKSTNGVDADDPNAGDAPQIMPGDTVNWAYLVTNTGNVTLNGIGVGDDQGVTVTCPGSTLAPGASFTCTASGVAEDLMNTGNTTVPGLCGSRPNTPLYENVGTVTGTTPSGSIVTDDDPSHYCNPEACALSVSKTCLIPIAPVSAWECTKPIDTLTMIYTGTQPVRIKAWKGDVGSTLLADIDDIQPGEEVSVMGFAGSPNDVFWEVFAAGTSTKLGESTFHLSCSDDEMDGPEDCGRAEGNGKSNDSGLLNVWLLEGIVDAGGTLDCTAPPTTGNNECEFSSFPASCETGDADFLTFLYTGGGCSASDNAQDDHECTGSINGNLAATFTDDDNNSVTLNPGDTITIPRNVAKAMTLSNAGGTETNVLHTSCSQPIAAGDVYGSLTLVQIDGMGVGTDVVYTYTIENSSNVDIVGLTAVDNILGPIPGAPSSLGAGQSVTLNASAFLTDTTTNIAIVDGTTADGQMCNGSAEATVTILPPPPCDVDGEGVLELSSDKAKWELTNNGSFTATIDSISIGWPSANGDLIEIKLGGDTIYDNDLSPDSAVITSWIGDLNKRQIQPGDTETLEIKFANDVVELQGAYSITVNFDEGCSVTYTNTGLPFVCTKPIDELSMIWDGNQDIRIKAYKGSIGSTLLLDQSGITPGTEVTVSGFAGSPNDVFWQILSGNSVIGESKFHLSCSDNDMNGAEDCGKRQGNGKDSGGFINDWLLEGMIDADGPFDCSNLP